MRKLAIVISVASLVLFATLFVGAAGAVPSVVMTDLGTLGGGFSQPAAINASGQVVGQSQIAADSEVHAFSWTEAGGMVDLGDLGGTVSYARAVNASGAVVGDRLTAANDLRAFAWTQAGGMVDLGDLGGTNSSAAAVNDRGQVVGYSNVAGDDFAHAFLWTQADGMVDLGALGDGGSIAFAISSTGQVVGYNYSFTAGFRQQRPFSWTQAGGMVDLGTLGGSLMTAMAVNASGQVVGWGTTAGDAETHAFSWTAAGGMVDLGTLGGNEAVALDVNASGQVVGYSRYGEPNPNAERHAFLWTQAGGMVDLGTLGGGYSEAAAVNDSGQVAGTSTTGSGEPHAFLWTEAGGMVDLGTLGGPSSNALAMNASGQVAGISVTPEGESHATFWTEAPGPVDTDGDGIDDAIDTGIGTFQDGATTAGMIGPVPSGYTVTVTDLPDPDGVRIEVAGSGTQTVTIALTNPATGAPCGTVRLLPGSNIDVLCGSVTVRVAADSSPAEIVLSDDTSVLVDAGEQATLSVAPGESFVVIAVSGGDERLTLVSNGVLNLIDASSPPVSLYDFVGFSQPVDNGGVLNVANAGRNIPLKWRLLTESGAPITNLASASVSIAQIDCQTGTASDLVEEFASSASALVNLGNGYYHLNWKTEKNWTGCKAMRLHLAGESPITHDALFQFK